MSDATSFSWEIDLPERGSSAAGRGRPRACLRISSATHGDECLSVPVAVGKRLDSLSREQEGPSGRSELIYLLKELSSECAHARMEDLVGRRDLSRLELVERLLQDGYRDEVAERIAERACEVGIIDDARYGAAFARSKVLAGWGRVRIERELERRGVDASAIPGWPDEFTSEEDERERAVALASRRRLTGKNDYQKIVRFLCSRGFAVGLSTSVAREVLEAADC